MELKECLEKRLQRERLIEEIRRISRIKNKARRWRRIRGGGRRKQSSQKNEVEKGQLSFMGCMMGILGCCLKIYGYSFLYLLQRTKSYVLDHIKMVEKEYHYSRMKNNKSIYHLSKPITHVYKGGGARRFFSWRERKSMLQ